MIQNVIHVILEDSETEVLLIMMLVSHTIFVLPRSEESPVFILCEKRGRHQSQKAKR
jgi:hypothetical protein